MTVLGFCKVLGEVIEDNYAAKWTHNVLKIDIQEGKRFYKLVRHDYDVETGQLVKFSGSVHCFVEKATGDIYKAASFKAPAKGVRFNIVKDLELLKEIADWAGGYLYR